MLRDAVIATTLSGGNRAIFSVLRKKTFVFRNPLKRLAQLDLSLVSMHSKASRSRQCC